jgi:hypothetical protein
MNVLVEVVFDLLLHLFDGFRWWRCGLCLIASLGAVVLAQAFLEDRAELWLTVAGAVLGLIIGMVWELRATDRRHFWN